MINCIECFTSAWWPWLPCPFILAFCPSKISCPAATVASMLHPHLPSIIFCYFATFSYASLLSLQYLDTSVCCWDSDSLSVKDWWNSEGWVRFLPWYEPLETATITLATHYRWPTRRFNWAHPDAAKLETRGKIWEEMADWATEVKTVW